MFRSAAVLLSAVVIGLASTDFCTACRWLQPNKIEIQATGDLVTLPGDITAVKKIPVQGFLRGDGSDILLNCVGNASAQKFLDEQAAKPQAGRLPLRRVEVKGRLVFPAPVRHTVGAHRQETAMIIVETLKLAKESTTIAPALSPRP